MSVRVLVVDDSAFARKVVREVLAAEPRIEVVDIARDGLDALEKIALHRPDVVTLDLTMPGLDGLGVLRALPPDAPRVVVVSVSGATTELGLEALELGAIDVVEKPTALATDRLYDLGKELVTKVLAAAAATARPRPATPPRRMPAPRPGGATEALVIGASTGGPPAVARLLASLPADLAVPVAVVVHLPVEYTDAFARRLDGASPFRVREAVDGLPLAAGEVVIARGGVHLALERAGGAVVCRLGVEPVALPHRPAVDVLFASAARAYGGAVLGVVLTGMGSDGLAGARAIVDAGGRVLTEAEASCVVYGMPRCVDEAGLSAGTAPLEELAALIVASV